MSVKVTESALQQMRKMLESKGPNDIKNVRIYMKGLGWGGPSFGIVLDEQYENDQNFTFNQINFVIEESLLKQFLSFEVDYKNGWLSQGFVVRSHRTRVSL